LGPPKSSASSGGGFGTPFAATGAAAFGAAAPPPKAGAAGAEKAKEIDKERVLRDDEECYVADSTAVNKQKENPPKFELFDQVRRARIARELVEMDAQVQLCIRTHPSTEAEEICVLAAGDVVEGVGTRGEWLRLAGSDEQWIKYMQSDKKDIPEQLVDFLGPSILTVASSLTSGDLLSTSIASYHIAHST